MPFINSVRGVFGAAGPVGVTAPPLITYSGTTYSLLTQTITFSTAGEYSISVFSKCQVRARVFGAGGGGSQTGGWNSPYVGGSGGYAGGILTLSPGTSKIIVGEGGSGNSGRVTIGGGASAQNKTSNTDNRYSACGGGFSGIFFGGGTIHDSTVSTGNTTYRTAGVQARALIIAGGGGGGGNRSDTSGMGPYTGGHGGGTDGIGGYGSTGSIDTSSAGTQSAAGSATPNQWGGNTAGAYMQGGHGGGEGYGAGGGGGYFGGSTANSANHMGGGGGGSGFLSSSVSNGSLIAGSSQTSPGGVGQTGYINGSGYGGGTGGSTSTSWTGGAGGAGIVILASL